MRKYEVIVKTSVEDAPESHEMSAAIILAYYFKTDITFLRPQHARTPDVEVNGTKWEIKSPIGNGKRTIHNNFREARGQSRNIVIDLRRIKMHQSKANARIRHYLSTAHRFKRVLVINKNKKVIVII